MLFQHFLIGLALLIVGGVTLKYNYQLIGITGNNEWVERYLGGGSTYGFTKFISVILCIAGFLYMFGLFDPVFGWLLSPLSGLFHAPQ